eukprot:TRINITY_DN4427_c0_g2_i1.p1 TRINITY_DN4427_c0_g2~~TRINITY_DN4427_c0_g2_i1.p1  ORF type:complete len:1225 (+),score=71.74 TRINITY_DN4427_c0_g2_i1:3458-7132(+)
MPSHVARGCFDCRKPATSTPLNQKFLDLDDLITQVCDNARSGGTPRSRSPPALRITEQHEAKPAPLRIRSWNIHKQPPGRYLQRYLPRFDVLLLQEVLRQPEQHFGTVYSNINGHSRGVVIALSQRVAALVCGVYASPEHDLLAVRIQLPLGPVWIACVYGHDLAQTGLHLETLARSAPVIAGGDWNSTPTHLDRTTNRCTNSSWIHDALEGEWVDVWREFRGAEREYTFHYVHQGVQGASRLDYFLVSRALMNSMASCTIAEETGSDHKPVDLEVLAALPECKVGVRPKPAKLKASSWKAIADLPAPSNKSRGGIWEASKQALETLADAIRSESGVSPHLQEGRTRVKDLGSVFWRSAHSGFTSRRLLDEIRGKKSPPLMFIRNETGDVEWDTKRVITHIGREMLSGWTPWATPVPVTTIQDFAASLDPHDIPEIPQFTLEDLKAYCERAPLKKATGRDNLNLGCLHKAPEWVKLETVNAVNESLRKGILPPWAKSGEVSFLYKGGDPLQLASYRPITIVPIIAKLLAHHIRRHLSEHLDYILGNEQHGFRKRHGTTTPAYQALAALRRSGGGCLLRVDLAKAFDAVPHVSLIRFLEELRVDRRSINGIKALYTHAPTYVRVRGVSATAVYLQTGVRQGCPLSPLLFAVWLSPLLRAITTKVPRSVSAFADDTQLLERTLGRLQKLATLMDDLSSAWSMRIRPNKTELFVSNGECGFILLQGERVVARQFRETVKVLGHLVARNDGVLATDLADEARCFFRSLAHTRLSPQGAANITRTFLIPLLAHRGALCAHTTTLQKVDKVVAAGIRQLAGLPSSAPSASIYTPRSQGGLGIPRMQDTVGRSKVPQWERLMAAGEPLGWHRYFRYALRPLGISVGPTIPPPKRVLYRVPGLCGHNTAKRVRTTGLWWATRTARLDRTDPPQVFCDASRDPITGESAIAIVLPGGTALANIGPTTSSTHAETIAAAAAVTIVHATAQRGVCIMSDSSTTVRVCTTALVEPRPNASAAERIIHNLAKGLTIKFKWVKGHASSRGNIEADRAARWAQAHIPTDVWPLNRPRNPTTMLHQGQRPLCAPHEVYRPPGNHDLRRPPSENFSPRCWRWLWGIVNSPPNLGYSYHRDTTPRLCPRCKASHDCTVVGTAAECASPQWSRVRQAILDKLERAALDLARNVTSDDQLTRLYASKSVRAVWKASGLDPPLVISSWVGQLESVLSNLPYFGSE